MIAFAGIVMPDRAPVPDGWIELFATRPSARVFRPAGDSSVAFVTWPRRVDGPAIDTFTSGPDGRILLLDSRIDNRGELCAAPGFDDAATTGPTDADLVLGAFAKWGDEVVARLIGEYALVLWEPVRRRLFMARDILGSRALDYYFPSSGTCFAVSTDLRVLLELPCIPRKLCEETVADYLTCDGSGPADSTFYDSVRILPAAHTLILDGGRVVRAPYWSPAEVSSSEPGDDDYARELRRRITEAVECRLRGGKRVAVHLSGGLDSSSLACIAARSLKRRGRRLLALCCLLPHGHDGPESDERAHIDAVLAQEDNIDPVWVRMPVENEPFRALTRWFDVLAQPSYSTVTHVEERLGEVGRSHGVDVVLSGFGGDLFASAPGWNAAGELLRAGRLRPAFSVLQSMHREQGRSWAKLLFREVLAPLLPNRASAVPSGCAHPDLLERLHGKRNPGARAPIFRPNTAPPREMMRFILAPGHIERMVSAVTQVFADEFSQELRFPLLDVRVIELMLNLPAEQFQLCGRPRSLMRRAMAGILPESIRLRRDKGGAFDPAITSRFVAARTDLVRWAEEAPDRRCWTYVDRSRFLEAVRAVEAAPREHWRQDFFRIVVYGGIIARFIEWNDGREGPACS